MNITIRAPRKKVVVALTLVIVLLIALIGTFAWNSLNQSRVNVFREVIKPNVNLHDIFEGGPNKDVFVENSGDVPLYVRVMLQEYLQTENRSSLIASANFGGGEGDDQLQIARDTWYPHNGLNMNTGGPGGATSHECYIDAVLGDMWPNECFHDYYKWTMGTDSRWIYYKPATLEQRGVDENGNPVQMTDESGEPIFDEAGSPIYVTPSVVADSLAETTPDPSAYYESEVKKLTDGGMSENDAMAQLGLKKTLVADRNVITMAEWKTAGYPTGNFWVVDVDGWCYWASPLQPGDATSLLLDQVDRTGTLFDSNAEYAINVWLQAVDESEFTETLRSPEAGGITTDAQLLMNFSAGNLLSDGSNPANLFRKNREGTFIAVNSVKDVENDGTGAAVLGEPKAGAKDFVLLGADTINGSVTVTPGTNTLEIGTYFTITDLEWNGDDYEAWGSGSGQYLWNITKLADITSGTTIDETSKYVTLSVGDAQVYQLTGITYGADGLMYLNVAPVKKVAEDGNADDYAPDNANGAYLGSAEKLGAESYKQLNPGYGPFVFIYPANAGGAIGTANDLRGDPSVDFGTRFFYHIGNGVYVETATKEGTTSKDSPVKYFFAGELVTKTKVSGTGGDVDMKVGEIFPLQLTVGDKFDVTFTEENKVYTASGNSFAASGSTFTLDSIVKGVNGQMYMYLGSTEEGYISIGTEKFLGIDGNRRVWAGPNGIGTGGDITAMPDLFGTGTANDPFRVADEESLIYIAQQVAAGTTYAGQYFRVVNDIDLSANLTNNFQRIGYRNRPFRGNFDGAGFTISSLVVNAGSAECFGLFGWVEQGTIKNVKMTDVNITGTYLYYGGIAGVLHNNGVIENCEVSGTITGGSSGGIAGWIGANTRITNCINNASVNAAGTYVGGIAGRLDAATSVVENSTNNGVITAAANYVGGVVGFSNGTVRNCVNETTGTVSGTAGQYLGGIVGETYGPVTNCENKAAIGTESNRRSHTGGVAGVNYATIEGCYNTGKVYGAGYTGGIVGLQNRNTAKILKSGNSGDVYSSGHYNGGIVGWAVAGSLVELSYNTASINPGASSQLNGGVAGYSLGNISNCYNTGAITGGLRYNGGVAGYHRDGTISGSFHAKGTITAASQYDTGGLVGYHNSGTLINNAVLDTTIAGGTNNRNAIVGNTYGGSRSLCYTNNITISTANNGWAGAGNIARNMNEFVSKLKISTSNWEWNSGFNFPTIKGVTK